METWREITSEPGEKAPRTCGGQSGAAQERSLDNNVISASRNVCDCVFSV